MLATPTKRPWRPATQWLWRTGLLGALTAGGFMACAEGSQLGESGTTTGTAVGTGAGAGTGAGGGIPAGQIGGPCETTDDCVDGSQCTQVGDAKYCTVACPPDCPQGTYCAIVQGDSICIPDLDHHCLQCNAKIDCEDPSDECLKAPLGDKFCARDCTTLGKCPNGFTCMAATEYAMTGSGTGATTGASTGSGTGTGGAGGAGGAPVDAGGDGPAPPPTGMPYKFCVPSGNLSCPCNSKRDGVTHTCFNQSASGKCQGTETCNGELAKWEGCTAGDPVPEICNGKDDNCDEQIDDGDRAALCAGEGAVPPHSSWVCAAGVCAKGPCAEGWADYPPGPIAAGCPCPVEASESNDTCANAATVGAVSDTPGSVTVITGTLSSASDVDVWKLDTFDTPEAGTNTYHISIDLTAPSQNTEFLFDVTRVATPSMCSDSPTGPTTGLVSYDWCVDGSSGTEGEITCSPEGAIQCGDHSSQYFLRVYRKPGATGSCTEYAITITGKGGDPCDFTQKCE